MQVPLIAATTGLGDASTSLISDSRFGSAIALGEPNSLMSAPPENALPAPVTTMALTAASASARSMAAANWRRVSRPRPLTGGLSRVTTATAPCTA